MIYRVKVYNFQSKSSSNSTARAKTWRGFLHNLNWPVIGKWAFRAAAIGVLLIAFLFIYYSRNLPNPNRLLGRDVPESTKIYARDGSQLYEVHGEIKRTLVNLDQISPYLKDATIAVEDKNFYHHGGISITGTLRSIIVDILHGQKEQGGSTITQQFVKNAVLTRDKSFLRKGKEIIISIELEARFSKDDILKLYLNEIPYGRNAYGIEAASETYFNKKATDLTIAESAYLAALPQAPSYYNPSGPHFDDLQARQKYILEQMKSQGYINDQQYNDALNEKVAFQTIKDSIVAPHFVQYVQDYLADKYGEQTLEEGGLQVYTTLDPKLQQIAEQAVKDGATKNQSANGYNAALVAQDPKTGQILAMVGSKDYFAEPQPAGCNPGTTGANSCLFEPNVNVATTYQQPGSSFKPYAYVTAFGRDFKYAPASMLMDVKTDFGNYSPNNFNLSQNGPVSMRKALAGSLNIPAVKTLALVGPDNVIKTARDVGITAPFQDCGLSLVLGGCDITLVDHTEGYATLANGGRREQQTAILKVVDKEGKVLEEFKENGQQVLDPQAVYEVTNIMSDNNARSFVFGSNSALTLGDRPVAAKTGTTQDFRDGWTLGFTPSLVAGVWTGNNNNVPMKKDAVLTAGPIWNAFMKQALAGTPVEQFQRPDGIREVTVDSLSGLLPTQYSPETKTEIFADYSVPTKYDDVHVPVKINVLTGLPADDSTPSDQVTTTIYTVLHSEKPNNPAWEDPVIAWALANGYKYPPGSGVDNTPPSPSGSVSITSPADNTLITKLPFTVSISPGDDVNHVDVAVDGSVINTLNGAPYSVNINQKYNDGSHTISARAYYNNGSNSSDSITVRFALDGSLSITEPNDGSTASFPISLSAESPIQYNNVTFYYQSGNTTKTIGPAVPSEDNGNYSYNGLWSTAVKPGTYKIYAKTNTGVTSNKITINTQ